MKREPFRFFMLFSALAEGAEDNEAAQELIDLAILTMDIATEGHQWGAHAAIGAAFRNRGAT